LKRILLLYTFDFSGHHKACLALRRSFRAADPQVRTHLAHFFDFIHPLFRRWGDSAYFSLIQAAPSIWGGLYDRSFGRASAWAIDRLSVAAEPGLGRLIARWKPDVVVCTQALPCIAVSNFKRKSGASFSIHGVLTDYHPHRFWAEASEAQFIVPSEYGRAALESCGVASSRIRTIGMPIDACYAVLAPEGRESVRGVLGLVPSLPHVVVMGGSRGFVDAERILSILERRPEDFQITLIAGKNVALFERLARRAAVSQKRVQVLPYVSQVDRWLRSADVLITKAGGLSVSEAIACGVPAILTGVLPGQEERNARLLEDHRSIFRASGPEEACAIALGILDERRAPLRPSFSTSAEIARDLLAVL